MKEPRRGDSMALSLIRMTKDDDRAVQVLIGFREGTHIFALLQAIGDVCAKCAGRATGWDKAEGPNSAGNWRHSREIRQVGERTPVIREVVICEASAIHARLRSLLS